MRQFPLLFITVAFFLTAGATRANAALHEIRRYKVMSRECIETETGDLLHASRSFLRDREPRYLVTDVESFETRVVDPSTLDCEDPAAAIRYETSPFAVARRKSSGAAHHPLSNDGISRAEKSVHGVFLTADLCPASHAKFEYRFFDALEKIAVTTSAPVPVGLAVTKKWINQHPGEFEDITRLEATGKIAVTWINHSSTHPFSTTKKLEANFLLEKGVNPETEITDVEIALLERNQLPSSFFRFPGLISDQAWVENVDAHSLITLGSDAWLAIGEKPKAGSVILVHANGNESLGITKFLETLTNIQSLGEFLPLAHLLK